MVIFFWKNYCGAQEAQYPQFLLQLPLTHYILRSIFFWTHSTPSICLKTQKCAILSTFLESGRKNYPKVGVRREKFNIGNCPQFFFQGLLYMLGVDHYIFVTFPNENFFTVTVSVTVTGVRWILWDFDKKEIFLGGGQKNKKHNFFLRTCMKV